MVSLPHLATHDLISLLSSRLCHDIISPVGAISNALELLEEGDNEALDLIRLSATQACVKLQYARLTYGVGANMPDKVPLKLLRPIVEDYMLNEKLQICWPDKQEIYLTKMEAKFLLNLLLIAYSSLPRGGKINIMLEAAERTKIYLNLTASTIRLAPKFEALQKGELAAQEIDPYSIQAYYTLFLAQELAYIIQIKTLESQLTFICE